MNKSPAEQAKLKKALAKASKANKASKIATAKALASAKGELSSSDIIKINKKKGKALKATSKAKAAIKHAKPYLFEPIGVHKCRAGYQTVPTKGKTNECWTAAKHYGFKGPKATVKILNSSRKPYGCYIETKNNYHKVFFNDDKKGNDKGI